jgi:1,4-alpha-glucan branching enzyme
MSAEVSTKPTSLSSRDVKSKVQGMGSLVFDRKQVSGVAFRVWAPHADKVYVTGDFNNADWESDAYAMEKEKDGNWYREVIGAKAGDRYHYVIEKGDQEWIKRDPYGKKLTEDQRSTIIYDPNEYEWQNEDFQLPSWNELVLYEIHVGTFNVRNLNNNKPATFKDCLKKIPYLKKLGINAISLMPIISFAGEYSWGYNSTDIFSVENTYGGPDDFKLFIDECHKNGIAVILDLVYNHAGPDNLDIWQFDGWSEDGKGGLYFYQDYKAQTPWGDTRYDYGRGEVRNYLRDNVTMWLEEYRLDGLRFDATHYIRKVDPTLSGDDIPEGWSLLQWLNEEKNRLFPWKISIAEDISNEPWVVKTVGEGGAGFDAQWDTSFVKIIRAQLIASEDGNRNMYDVKRAIERNYNNAAFQRVIYTESHDDVANGEARLTYEIDLTEDHNRSFFSKKRSILGAGIVLTSPGIPMIFQGQEMLEDMWFEDTDPIDWFLAQKYKGIIHAYRDLIRLRRNKFENTRGLQGQHCDVFHVNDEQKVIAYHRWDEGGAGDDVVIIASFSNNAYENYNIGMPRPGIWKVRFNSSSRLYDKYIDDHFCYDTEAVEAENDNHQWSANTGLGAYALVILSQDE